MLLDSLDEFRMSKNAQFCSVDADFFSALRCRCGSQRANYRPSCGYGACHFEWGLIERSKDKVAMRLLIAYDGSESADAALEDDTCRLTCLGRGVGSDGRRSLATATATFRRRDRRKAGERPTWLGAQIYGDVTSRYRRRQAGSKSSWKISSELSAVEGKSRGGLGLTNMATFFESGSFSG
jgi:hypothetical protein